MIFHGFHDLKTLFFPILLHCLHISRYLRHIFYTKICGLIRKSACPIGQVETKMYLPESHYFKNSLAGASGLVLISDPVNKHYKYTYSWCNCPSFSETDDSHMRGVQSYLQNEEHPNAPHVRA